MNGYHIVYLTPNIQYCLDVFKDVVDATTDKNLKKKGEEALEYIKYSFAGKVQPMGGHGCPDRISPK